MSYPTITIVIFTHMARGARHGYAKRCIASLGPLLYYSGDLRLHIADDNSPKDRFEDVVAQAREYGFPVSATRAGGTGYGGSYNAATQVIHNATDLVLCVEDDWECINPYLLEPHAEALADPRINAVRFGYLGWTQPLRGEVIQAGGMPYLLFDPESPERHVFAGHPRLETVAYQRAVGPWPEGEDAGTTEFVVAGRPEARRGVVWPIGLAPHSLWAHIGTVQARSDQQ